jgi:hypothetical protein
LHDGVVRWVVAVVMLVGCARPTPRPLSLRSVPRVVAEAIEREAAGDAISKIAWDPDVETGRVDATWYVDGVRHELTVDVTGRVVDRGVEVEAARVPAIVVEQGRRVYGDAVTLYYLRLDERRFMVQWFSGRHGRRKREIVIRVDGEIEDRDPDCDTE